MTRADRADSVSTYYERNTRWFLRTRGRAASGSLHRVVWGPGVRSRHEALAYVDQLVEEVLARRVAPDRTPAQVVDLGCGVGATVARLARWPGVRATGLTLSRRQAELARARARHHGVAARCRFEHRDLRDTQGAPAADLAIAIESLAHVAGPERVFPALREHVRPGGWLVVCDDFETPRPRRHPDRGRARWLRRFRDGWYLDGLSTVGDFVAAAQRHGFRLVENRDLSPYIRRDPAVLRYLCHALNLLPMRASVLDGLRGGAAGQRCLARGWAQYRFVVFHRPRAPDPGGEAGPRAPVAPPAGAS